MALVLWWALCAGSRFQWTLSFKPECMLVCIYHLLGSAAGKFYLGAVTILLDENCLAIAAQLPSSLCNFIVTGFSSFKIGECSFSCFCGRSITANFCSEISALITCINFCVSPPVLGSELCIQPFSGIGGCGWMPREQHLAAEAGCTCHAVRTPSFVLPVSLLVWQLARHCTQNPNSLLLESLSWISNKGSALIVKLYYEWDVHRDKTVVKLEPFWFALPLCFALEVFNPVEKNAAGRGRENCLPFSQVQNTERAEIFQDVCPLSIHHAFLFPLTV